MLLYSGSSPHAWGIRRSVRLRRSCSPVHPHTRGAYDRLKKTGLVHFRFIPTRVGHTGGLNRVHLISVRFIPTRVGHTHDRRAGPRVLQRFIPTRVGHTCGYLFSPLLPLRFIPTRVGHTMLASSPLMPHNGSSPHAWGIRRWEMCDSIDCAVHPHTRGAYGYIHFVEHYDRRFIPTRVGHTQRRGTLAPRRTTVHPHTRGAYYGAPVLATPYARFIPTRVGHTHGGEYICLADRRFIPTRVGHTDDILRIEIIHCGSSPHAWGILFFGLPKGDERDGSSPHAWGIPHPVCRRILYPRFIPTRVGHTVTCARSSAGCPTVHPHTRGAYEPTDCVTFVCHGSSPHAWGILIAACVILVPGPSNKQVVAAIGIGILPPSRIAIIDAFSCSIIARSKYT